MHPAVCSAELEEGWLDSKQVSVLADFLVACQDRLEFTCGVEINGRPVIVQAAVKRQPGAFLNPGMIARCG